MGEIRFLINLLNEKYAPRMKYLTDKVGVLADQKVFVGKDKRYFCWTNYLFLSSYIMYAKTYLWVQMRKEKFHLLID